MYQRCTGFGAKPPVCQKSKPDRRTAAEGWASAALNNANLTGVALNFFSVVGATGCSTVTPTGALNGYINGNGCYN